MSKSKDPFALLKSLGLVDIPSAEELAKVDSATGAKLLSQAMNATNVRKLATAESKRDTRQPVTSNAGIFGSLLTQAVGRNDAAKAMKTLEGDAKLFAKSQAAIEKFDRGLALRAEKNALGDKNLGLYKDDVANQRAVEAASKLEQGKNRRHNENLAATLQEANAVDYTEVRNLQKALTGVESLFASNNELAKFREENPKVQLNGASIANLNVHLTQASEAMGQLEKERSAQEGSTTTARRPHERGGKADPNQEKIDALMVRRANGQLNAAESQVLDAMIAQQGGRRHRSDMSGSELDVLNNGAEDTLNENYDARREHEDNSLRGTGMFNNQSTTQITADINDRDVDESKRDTLLEKKLWMLTKNAINDVTLKLGGTTVTDTMREDLSQMYGLNPYATQASQIAALNIQQKKLYQEAKAISGGYEPNVRATYAGEDGFSGSILNSLDQSDTPLMKQPGEAGLTPEQEAEADRNPGINPVLESVGDGINGTSGQRAARQTGIVPGAVEQALQNTGASDVVDKAINTGGAVLDKVVPSFLFPKTQEKVKNKGLEHLGKPPAKRPPDPRQASNSPMDIFKTPENEGQANALAQTIQILQSQSQLGQRNA